jgi:ribosomal protein S7
MSREKEKANLRFLRLIFLHFKKKPMTVKKSLGGVREVPLQHSVIPDKNKKLDPYFYEPESMRKFRFGRFWGSFFSANYDYTARKWLCANQISTSYYLTSDYICHKLINKMMKNGEKQVIYNIFFKVVSALKKEFDVIDPRPNIVRAIMKLRPLVSFKKIVVSGITRKVPASISVRSSVNVALGWFVSSVRSRKEKTIAARLVHEFVSLNFDKPCQSFKKKVEYHGLAKINRYLIKRVPFLKNKKKKTVSARTLKFFKKKWKKV